MTQKTNAMRLLDSLRIPYQVHEFSSDIRSAAEVAELLGVPTNQVYKTLVVTRERGRPLLVLISGSQALDLKRLAQAVGEKKLRMAAHKEAEAITGLSVGGISALSLTRKGFVVYTDEPILTLDRVYVSAGRRGINLSLLPDDLIRITGARVVRLTAPEGSEDKE